MSAALSTFARALALELTLALPLAGLGWLAAGWRGAAAAAALGTLVLLITAFRGERIVGRLHGARDALPGGLRRTLGRVLDAESGAAPRLLLVPDPSPNALVAGSLGGGRTIFLTQGLVALLTEPELRAILTQCVRRARAPGAALRTLTAVLAYRVLSAAPREWTELALTGTSRSERLSPLRAILFCALFPAGTWLVRLGGRPEPGGDPGPAWADAARKIDAQIRRWGSQAYPGMLALQLFYPWPGGNVLPFPCVPGRTGLNPST
jgi:hypothetical protein